MQGHLEPDFSRPPLLIEELESDPIVQFEKWFREAWDENYPMPHAMSLATASAEGLPTVRTVLLKGYDSNGFVFFTNYGSRKAKQISNNPQAALLFPWVRLGRQVTVAGRVEKISKSESVQYFLSRPRGSQLSAWASAQSTVISSRAILESAFATVKRRFADGEVPLPDFWGGYRVDPDSIEFWQNRKDRLHDRFLYNRGENGAWRIDRLTP
ncbi:MAG: pyridoxamine 5'-phosphate oxidase [Pseudomonadota bacterium]|nr:pyridoxamine 5'-phosphate oxidase [Pseudomonadota bacterium]